MGKLLNQDKAREFRTNINDRVVRGLCTIAFGQLILNNEPFEGDFDVLFYTKMIYELVKDKEFLIKELQGGGEDGVFRD